MCSSQGQTPLSQYIKITAPYGSWKSRRKAINIVSLSSKPLGGTALYSQVHVFWLESRPSGSGRAVLAKEAEKPRDEPIDITPKEFSKRTVAQEYGGGTFRISEDAVIFSNYKDQGFYKQSISSKGLRGQIDDTLPPSYTRMISGLAHWFIPDNPFPFLEGDNYIC